MLIAARNSFLVGGKLSAKSYVQDGLVAMWDGIENAGWGEHDPNATVWKDLVGNRDGDIDYAKVSIGDKSIIFDNSSRVIPVNSVPSTIGAVQCCAKFNGFNSNNSVLQIPFFTSPRVAATYGVISSHDLPYNEVYVGQNSYEGGIYYRNEIFGNTRTYTINGRADYDVVILPDVQRIGTSSFVFGSGAQYYGLFGRNYGPDSANQYTPLGDVYNLRIYSRTLTADEIAANYAIDKIRFNLP